jgi:hypothetical protein
LIYKNEKQKLFKQASLFSFLWFGVVLDPTEEKGKVENVLKLFVLLSFILNFTEFNRSWQIYPFLNSLSNLDQKLSRKWTFKSVTSMMGCGIWVKTTNFLAHSFGHNPHYFGFVSFLKSRLFREQKNAFMWVFLTQMSK